MSNKKIDLITGAYDRMRISGLTVNPGPRENAIAVEHLEELAALWEDNNVCAGYNFEDSPDLNSDSGIERKHRIAFKSSLAVGLLSYYGKTPLPTLLLEMQGSLSAIVSSTATPRQTQYPSRQPRGRGNRWNERWNSYYTEVARVPNDCESVRMVVGDVDDFTEHFDSYLRVPEVISTFTIEADDGLTINSSSLSSPDVLYRISADGNTENVNDSLLQVKIVVTTDTGRIETRIINFELKVA